jgi:hypothetical protein
METLRIAPAERRCARKPQLRPEKRNGGKSVPPTWTKEQRMYEGFVPRASLDFACTQ